MSVGSVPQFGKLYAGSAVDRPRVVDKIASKATTDITYTDAMQGIRLVKNVMSTSNMTRPCDAQNPDLKVLVQMLAPLSDGVDGADEAKVAKAFGNPESDFAAGGGRGRPRMFVGDIEKLEKLRECVALIISTCAGANLDDSVPFLSQMVLAAARRELTPVAKAQSPARLAIMPGADAYPMSPTQPYRLARNLRPLELFPAGDDILDLMSKNRQQELALVMYNRERLGDDVHKIASGIAEEKEHVDKAMVRAVTRRKVWACVNPNAVSPKNACRKMRGTSASAKGLDTYSNHTTCSESCFVAPVEGVGSDF